MGGFMGSLSAKSAYMLMFVRESHASSVFDKSGLSTLVSPEVEAAVQEDCPASLPQAFTIALPHGRGVMTKAGEGDGGGGGKAGKEKGGGGAERKLRGLLVGVTVPDAENATVKDLLRLLVEQCKANGQPLTPPSPDEYWGGVPPPWEGYEPDLALVLTSVKNNVINFFYDNEDHPLSQVSAPAIQKDIPGGLGNLLAWLLACALTALLRGLEACALDRNSRPSCPPTV